MTSQVWVIVTCKGRLEFLQRTAPGLLGQGVGYCLVDYDCPQRSGEWLLSLAAGMGCSEKVHVVRHPLAPRFHKTHAQNLGARAAMARGARHLIFSDADTIHRPGSVEAVLALLAPRTFVIAGRDAQDLSIRSLTGFIALPAPDFVDGGGYDEGLVGWGAEDIELRLRLHLQHWLAFRELDHRYLEPIPHSDALRAEFMENPDLMASDGKNWGVLRKRLQQWAGLQPAELAPPASRLLMQLPMRPAVSPAPRAGAERSAGIER